MTRLVISGVGVVSSFSSFGSARIIFGFAGSSFSTRTRLAAVRVGSSLSGKPLTITLSAIFSFENPAFVIPSSLVCIEVTVIFWISTLDCFRFSDIMVI